LRGFAKQSLKQMKRGGAVYIMTNKIHSVLYTGVTSDLKKRVYEHKNDFHPDSFTAIYKTYKLVYYEGFHRIEDAIAREKQIKAGSRNTKNKLITSFNPEWRDLYDDILFW
jgi:putative endonuclease